MVMSRIKKSCDPSARSINVDHAIDRMRTLPDLVFPDMTILFVGTNPGAKSARIGHYFAGTSNMFWRLLHESGLTSKKLRTELDYMVREYGYGLTDVIKRPTRSTSDLNMHDSDGSYQRLNTIVLENKPHIVAFVGKTGFRHYAEEHKAVLRYGRQEISIGKSEVYLMPSTSGQSFADTKYNEKLYWYQSLEKRASEIKFGHMTS